MKLINCATVTSHDSVVLHCRESWQITYSFRRNIFGYSVRVHQTLCSYWNRRDLCCIQISDNLSMWCSRFTHCDFMGVMFGTRHTRRAAIHTIFVHMEMIQSRCRRHEAKNLDRLRPHSTEMQTFYQCSGLSFSFYIPFVKRA